MIRDLDLIRTILFEIERNEDATGHGFICLHLPDYSREQVSYHVRLLHEAKLIDAVNASTLSSYVWHPSRLTWEGHELLDSARDENVWKRAKKKAEEIGNLSLEVLKQILINHLTI